MALRLYKFAYDNEKLSRLLEFSLSAMVADDLVHFVWPGRVCNLELLFSERGFGHEVGLDIDFLPADKASPVELVLICYGDGAPHYAEAALFTIEEFESSLYHQLIDQSSSDPDQRDRATQLIKKLDLDKYGAR